jgi:hypothetical protein
MVENVLEVQRGRGRAGAVTGLVTGAIFVVAPLALVGPVAGTWFVIELCCVAYGLRWRRISTWPLAVFTCWAVLIAAAASAPLKPDDQPIPVELSATTLRVAELSRELRLDEAVFDLTPVSLPSRRPTWRELQAAFASQTRWELIRPWCGFGTSILFGGHPRGRAALVEPAP